MPIFINLIRIRGHLIAPESYLKSEFRFSSLRSLSLLKMVLADLGRKITCALQSLSKATVINEEVNQICNNNNNKFKDYFIQT